MRAREYKPQRYEDRHFVAITLIAVAVAIIMTPAALHRGTGSKKVTTTFVNLTARLLFWSMLPASLVFRKSLD